MNTLETSKYCGELQQQCPPRHVFADGGGGWGNGEKGLADGESDIPSASQTMSLLQVSGIRRYVMVFAKLGL